VLKVFGTDIDVPWDTGMTDGIVCWDAEYLTMPPSEQTSLGGTPCWGWQVTAADLMKELENISLTALLDSEEGG
jgi:hypothetical protein